VSPTVVGEQLMNGAGPRLEEVQAEMSALAEMSDKPAGTIRITTSDHAAKTIRRWFSACSPHRFDRSCRATTQWSGSA
jgi:DNA-binding transcriptional LysR family regulator